MRLRGTGKDPDHKYPEGLVFDAPPQAARAIIDAGYATQLDPKDDPARTPSQIAGAVQRGDSLNEPTDAELAAGISESDALETVHGGPVDTPVDGGPVAKAPPGVNSEVLPPSPDGAGEAADAGETSDGSSTGSESSESEPPKKLTSKQEAVERAKELDISHSGSEADIRKRIAAKEKEVTEEAAAKAEEAAKAAPSEELLAKATELELQVEEDETTGVLEERITAKEKELEENASA